MIINDINLVELVAEGNNYLTNSEENQTFKKLVIKPDDISKYKEITKEAGEVIIQKLIDAGKEFLEDLIEDALNK